MATSARHFDLLREMKDAYNHRLRLVESAKQRGLKPTARLFATTVPTVRKWLRRFQQPSRRLRTGDFITRLAACIGARSSQRYGTISSFRFSAAKNGPKRSSKRLLVLFFF